MTRARDLARYNDFSGTELILDADGDTSITADTDDTIHIKIAGSDVVTLDPSGNVSATGTLPAGQLTGDLPAIDGSSLTGIATSDIAAASIGTSDNSNGYIKFTNNFVIQWLRKSTTGNHTITYPLAMDNFYGVYVAPEHTGSGHVRVHSISATQITLGNAESNIQGWALITGRKT